MVVFDGVWFAPRKVRKVLLVDDDAATLQHWSRACTKLGKFPLAAETPAAALALARAEQPDTAVVDFYLGDARAFDVVPGLRELVPDIYIAVLSGKLFMAANDLAALVHVGANDCLSKNVRLADLFDGIERGARPKLPESEALLTREDVERLVLEHALRACDYNITRAAAALSVSTPTIRSWIAKHGVQVPRASRKKNSGIGLAIIVAR